MNRHEIKVNGGVVAAGSILTAEAGAELLRNGGNAVDAAVAANLAAFCAEPVLTGPFGGGLALVAGENIEPVSMNFFSRVPGKGNQTDKSNIDFQGIDVRFGPALQTFHVGKGSCAIPLLLPGLLELHSLYGSVPLNDVIAPAMAYARDGIEVSFELARIFQILDPILKLTPEARQIFAPEGELLKAGDFFNAPGLVNVFEQFATGDMTPILESFRQTFAAPGGLVTDTDLLDLAPKITKPVHVHAGEFDIYLSPAPASGGLLVGFGLKLFEKMAPHVWSNPTDKALALVAAMTTTQMAREQILDPLLHEHGNHAETQLKNFLSESSMERWRNVFHEAFTSRTPIILPPENQLGSTTHISTLDMHGLGCSITSSNGEGSGHIVPGTSAMANNFMGEEDLHPQGFHVMPAGSMLTSMMCPTAVTDSHGPKLMLGTGGSNRIRTALLQVLGGHLFGKQSLEEAVSAPRIHYEGGMLYMESVGTDERPMNAQAFDTLKSLPVENLIFDETNMFFGGVNAAGRDYQGAGDKRRGGNIAIVKPESER
ncbi:MAG: gamma-glutamyltransferase [Deltaproteobacteria bacterium]|jgi:gamma-glutamyltranspeptidase / glutathione hydrolase|nr:gamma-glutamyltransferase [Deltaproteobacteria bacterium]MBT6435509.1 gamma-glutamyltransferase [Deltaproteobacteria bacterium]MBT6490622.1 gamma-glutamyltransferase [Deltaproteobacteria bacterium]